MRSLLYFLVFFPISLFSQNVPDCYEQGKDGKTAQYFHAIKELHKLELSGNEEILDVGCYDGEVTHAVAKNWLQKGGSIHGIDASDACIQTAKSKLATNQVTFESVSLFDYKPTKLYDVVVCFWTLYKFENYRDALKQLLSFVKPQGKALICHIIDPGTPYYRKLREKIAPQKISVVLPSEELIKSAIEQSECVSTHFEIMENFDKYPNLTKLIEAMATIPFFNGLSETQAKEFSEELKAVYPAEKDGAIIDRALVLRMILQKKIE